LFEDDGLYWDLIDSAIFEKFIFYFAKHMHRSIFSVDHFSEGYKDTVLDRLSLHHSEKISTMIDNAIAVNLSQWVHDTILPKTARDIENLIKKGVSTCVFDKDILIGHLSVTPVWKEYAKIGSIIVDWSYRWCWVMKTLIDASMTLWFDEKKVYLRSCDAWVIHTFKKMWFTSYSKNDVRTIENDFLTLIEQPENWWFIGEHKSILTNFNLLRNLQWN